MFIKWRIVYVCVHPKPYAKHFTHISFNPQNNFEI